MRIKQSIECWLFHREFGKFLLLKCPATPRHPEYWQPVTGGVWQREPLLHACLREVREETGIALNEADVIVIHDEVHVFVPEYNLEVRKPIFTAATNVSEIQVSDEHLAYQWVAPEAVPSMLFWESNKRTFADVQAFYQHAPFVLEEEKSELHLLKR